MVNDAAVNIGVQKSVPDPAFCSLMYVLGSRIAGSCNSVFNFFV